MFWTPEVVITRRNPLFFNELPQYQDLHGNLEGQGSSQQYLVYIPYRHWIRFTAVVTVATFTLCVIWALYEDFDAATATLCNGMQVLNYLPSFSAATGHFELCKAMWRFVVSMQALPRYIYARMYYCHLNAIISKPFRPWIYLLVVLSVCESTGLLGLSFFSSTENYPIHEKSFYLFLYCGLFYQLLLSSLLTWARRQGYGHAGLALSNPYESTGLKWKWRCFGLKVFCSIALYFIFERHSSYCERGMYSIFALVEYIVVLANILFHMSSCYDFWYKTITI